MAENVKEFAGIAQLINFDQYRALAEGFSAHMWEWYTGFIIWKTQNPWTALRGQMYDWYLDPNAGLFGLQSGSEPLHIMYNPVNHMIMVVNNTFDFCRDVMVVADSYDHTGKSSRLYQQMADIEPVSIKNCQSIGRGITSRTREEGSFLSLKLLESEDVVLSENLYWLPDSTGNYTFLQKLPATTIRATAENAGDGKIDLKLANDEQNPLAFFIRISLIDIDSSERILPVFYTENYVNLEPGRNRVVQIKYPADLEREKLKIRLEGWNVEPITIHIE